MEDHVIPVDTHHHPRPLRIAMVLPPWYRVPPTGCGGIEAVCAALVDGLVDRGHDVTVFGAGTLTGSRARFVSTIPELQHPRLGEVAPAALHAARVDALLREERFDVVHDHSPCGPLNPRGRTAPTVVTVHGPVDGETDDLFEALGSTVALVAISAAQRRRPRLAWAATIHNAVDPDQFRCVASAHGPVLWLARFAPEKGPDLAIQACRAAGLPLVLAGKCSEPAEVEYLNQVIRPMLGADTRLVLNADRDTTRGLLAAARCLLMPIRWHEPFGMVMVEAVASGTPVVALRMGSVPEIVRDGVTGIICDDARSLPTALHGVGVIDPSECVAHVLACLAADLMARRYEAVYRQLTGRIPLRHTWEPWSAHRGTVDDILR
jgi:glycosyltransferase involved in cell wall biosynthesis